MYDYVKFMDEMLLIENQLEESLLRLEVMHPSKILLETTVALNEASDAKESIKNSLGKLKESITNLKQKFREVFTRIKTENSEWLQDAKNFNVSAVDTSNVEFKIFPYWKNFNLFSSVRIPDFLESDVNLLSGNGLEYKKKYFKNIVDDDGNISAAKNVFRGANEKIILKGDQVRSRFPDLIKMVSEYEKICNALLRIDNMIIRIIESNYKKIESSNMNESALLENSLFGDEVMDVLLEVMTPDSVNNSSSDDDKATDEKVDEYSDKNTIRAIKNYVKICYSVNSIKKDMIEEVYSESAKVIDRVMKIKKKPK